MVKEFKGNLLDFPEDINVIAHQANTLNVMGAGIALQIKDKWPEVYETDRDFSNQHMAKLGLFSATKVKEGIVVNLYGQNNINGGRNTDYEGIYSAMNKLYELMSSPENMGKYVVGFPHGMSCGLAGGDWRIIHTMIESLADKYGVETRIVKYECKETNES